MLLGWVGLDLVSPSSLISPVVAWLSHSCLSAFQGHSTCPVFLLWGAGLPLVPPDAASTCD